MSQPLRRYSRHTEAEQDRAKIAAILRHVGDPEPVRVGHATAGGDERKLRGIPAIGRGVTGAIPGTVPHSQR